MNVLYNDPIMAAFVDEAREWYIDNHLNTPVIRPKRTGMMISRYLFRFRRRRKRIILSEDDTISVTISCSDEEIL